MEFNTSISVHTVGRTIKPKAGAAVQKTCLCFEPVPDVRIFVAHEDVDGYFASIFEVYGKYKLVESSRGSFGDISSSEDL